MMTTAETRLASAGIELPPAVTPFGPYVPAVQTGRLLFLSGMIPTVGHQPLFVGRVGSELNLEQGRAAARAATLNALAVVKAQLGSLDTVTRVVKLGVYIVTGDAPIDLIHVADGASELLRDVFGEDKLPVRLVFAVAALPLGLHVEIEVVFELAA